MEKYNLVPRKYEGINCIPYMLIYMFRFGFFLWFSSNCAMTLCMYLQPTKAAHKYICTFISLSYFVHPLKTLFYCGKMVHVASQLGFLCLLHCLGGPSNIAIALQSTAQLQVKCIFYILQVKCIFYI